MKHLKNTCIGLLLALVLLTGLIVPAAAVSPDTLSAALGDTAEYMVNTVKHPQVGSIGGEWAVLGLARSGCPVPENYYPDYYAAVEDSVRACGGVLHDKTYTEYSRVITALASIGKDARNVAGYDLTKPLGDYEKTIWQGLNGPIWALIALDSRDYPMPQNPQAKTQATRQMYVDRILACQLADGGWSLLGGTPSATVQDSVSDPNITGMALQALAKYQHQPAVAAAIQRALTCMSQQQNQAGGFGTANTADVESCVQMIVALCELGLPLDDSRFVKNGCTLLDNLMSFYQPGAGFRHTAGGVGSSQMASEQGFYALAAIQRANKGKNSLYRMADAISIGTGSTQPTVGLPGKHADVTLRPIAYPGKTFSDLSGSSHRAAIEALAARGIVKGKSDTCFDPNANLTRAEFSTILVSGLGLTPKASSVFTDVAAGKWYASYIGTAHRYGLVSGVGNGRFAPNSTITRQEAAVMLTRAAALCGMDTGMDTTAIRDVLAQFGDYTKSAQWARAGLAFCYDSGILDDSELDIQPTLAVKRDECAEMMYQLLNRAKLL